MLMHDRMQVGKLAAELKKAKAPPVSSSTSSNEKDLATLKQENEVRDCDCDEPLVSWLTLRDALVGVESCT